MKKMLKTFAFAMLVAGSYISVQLLASSASAQQVPRRQLQQDQPIIPATTAVRSLSVPSRSVPVTNTLNEADAAATVLDVPINEAKVVNLPGRVQNIDVGDEKIANVSYFPENDRQIFIHGRGFGKTTIIVTGANNNILRHIEVNVVFNPSGLKAALKRLLPNEKINVSVNRGNIFLTGKVRSAAASANAVAIANRFAGTGTAAAGGGAPVVNVVNMLTLLGSQQVIMKVRVSEMDRTVIKGMSVDQTFTSRFLNGSGSLSFSTTGLTQFDSSINPFVSGTLTSNISGLAPSTFKMLEKQKLVKTLAEPVLTAISGESATFLAGGQVPVITGVDQNNNAVYAYHDYGVLLEFTPVVIDHGRISLKIKTEISAISGTTAITSSVSLSNFTTKRTTTTVELPSGGSVMISGMLKDNDTNTVAGFPFLKDIPILGALFRSSDFKKQKTELVVTVSAYLAKPTGADAALSLPTDGFEPASDIDIYLLGKLHRQYTNSDLPIWAAPLKGPFGYIME